MQPAGHRSDQAYAFLFQFLVTVMEDTNLIPKSPPNYYSTTAASPPIQFSRHLTLFAAAAAIVLCVVGASGNLLTVVALARDVKLRQKATTYFVISLALSDLFFCVINLPLTAARYIQQEWTLGPALCRIFPFFFYGNVAASLMSMVAITINRYVLIAYYSYYNSIYTLRNTLLMIAAVWIFSFGMIFPPLMDIWGTLGLDEETFSCTIKKLDGKSPKKFLFLVAFCLPSISILLCYSAIYYKVKTSRNNMSAYSSPVSVAKCKSITRSHTCEDFKLTKMMLTIFLLFLICFLPLMLVNVLDDDIRQPLVHIVASVLAWMSAAVNPAIYAFHNQTYQKAFYTLLCGTHTNTQSPDPEFSCYLAGSATPDSSKSCSLASCQPVQLKYFSQDKDFTIVHEKDAHTQGQLMNMGEVIEKPLVH